ncbi:MAG: hypothetical protein AB7P33_11500 [Dehalococcoidia bacterium]
MSNVYRPSEDDNAWLDDLLEDFGGEAPDEEALAGEEPPLPPPPPRSRLRLLAGWLAAAAVLAVIGFGLLQAGERYHNPASRIPAAPSGEAVTGVYGTTQALQARLTAIQRLIPAGSALSLDDDVNRIDFPRTVADRLFGKRKEDALLFGARTSDGVRLQVMVLREDGEPRVFAVERTPRDATDLEGLYIGLPPGALLDALTPLFEEAAGRSQRAHSAEDYTIFGPFNAGNVEHLRARVEANPVLRHQVAAIEASGNDVSIAASAFLVAVPPGGNRRINALYQPSTNLVLQPLWGEDATDSLAHELVHAMMDEVVPNESGAQRQAQVYLEANQPHLYRDIIGDLYQPLDPLGRAEEAIAFITGAVAAGQPTTVAPAQLLGNQNLLERSAGLLTSDIDFLIGLGILPSCMTPASMGYDKRTLDFDFFRRVDRACTTAP